MNQQPPEPQSGLSQPGRNLGRQVVVTAATLLGIIIAAAYLSGSRGRVVLSPPVPLTVFQGSEVDPALSPDGTQVALAWNGERQDNFDIYILTIGSGGLRRLTADAAHEVSPAWSPDGGAIAFLRRLDDDRAALLVAPAAGGPERAIGEIRNDEIRLPQQLGSLSWSPDGRGIAAAHREPGEPHEGIYLFSINGAKRRLTNSPADSHGDHAPAFSPDGRKLAFSRLLGFVNSEIYVLSLDTNGQPSGEVRLTHHKRWSSNPVWTGGGETSCFCSGIRGRIANSE
jgi:Tol biopolymer transport system component